MSRAELSDFLRRRREALQPQQVGMEAGRRRRTPGLRREEVAQLAGMSTDYYGRLEQGRGPNPSLQLLASLARALRLTRDEREHLFHLAGQAPPLERVKEPHVLPVLQLLLDRLVDTPAQVMSDIGQVMAQNSMSVALLGDHISQTGPNRNFTYRWFTDESARQIYPSEDRAHHSRLMVADLRMAVGRRPDDAAATTLVKALRTASAEFSRLWELHEVALRHGDRKRIVHPSLGVIDLHYEVLLSELQDQRLVVLSARPGSPAVEQLESLMDCR